MNFSTSLDKKNSKDYLLQMVYFYHVEAKLIYFTLHIIPTFHIWVL